jgi:hypothetical protein
MVAPLCPSIIYTKKNKNKNSPHLRLAKISGKSRDEDNSL